MIAEPKGPEPYLSMTAIGRDSVPDGSPIRTLDRWWREKRLSTGLYPKRTDVDPIELGATLIPWLFIASVIRGKTDMDYRFRLIGTANARLVGHDATGVLASELFGSSDRTMIKTSFDETLKKGEPTFWRAAIPHKHHFPVPVFRALYPLADDGKTVDHIVGTAIPENVVD